jgi:hypothetical protein
LPAALEQRLAQELSTAFEPQRLLCLTPQRLSEPEPAQLARELVPPGTVQKQERLLVH